MEEFDYKGFMQDFKIADVFGIKAIKDTYKRAFEEWKDNADYFGSFVLTLNHLLWYHYEQGNMEYARLYDSLWKKADNFVYEHFKGDDLQKIIAFLD